jgi:hypothetical protein
MGGGKKGGGSGAKGENGCGMGGGKKGSWTKGEKRIGQG